MVKYIFLVVVIVTSKISNLIYPTTKKNKKIYKEIPVNFHPLKKEQHN